MEKPDEKNLLKSKKLKVEEKQQIRTQQDEKITLSQVGDAVISRVETNVSSETESSGIIQRANLSKKEKLWFLNRDARKARRKERRMHLKESVSTVFKVFKIAKAHQYLLWLTIAFDLIGIFMELCIPAVLGKAIDCIVGKNNVDFSALLNYVSLLAGLIVLSALEKWLEALFTNLYCIKASRTFRTVLFNKFNRVPLSVIDNNQHGDLLDRMVNDIEDATTGFLDSIQSVFSGVITIIGTMVFMLVLNVKMAAIIIAITPISVLFTLIIAKRSRVLYSKMAKAQGALSGYMEEYISGQRVVNAFGYEKHAIAGYDKINHDFYVVSEKAQFLSKLIGPITRFINGLVYGVVGLFGSIYAIRGLMSVGLISSFLTYANSYGKPFSEISDEISEIQEAFASARRIFEVLEKKDEPSDANLKNLEVADGSIKIEHAYFSYVPNQKLIQDLNLEVLPGQKIAIVGPTGCGKSTLINLLMRFYDLNSGRIIFSGEDSTKITRASLRTKFGMVLQESWLFSGTVAENIAYGKPNATQQEIEEAAKMAGVHETILKMKDGYNTKIEDGGSNVSQGQKQLLCIARIMLLKPPMLILDEATSNIDTNTEMKIQEAFNTIMKGRTSFIIAHRLSTITNADVILVMNKGNVIEQGSHAELMAKKGFYYHLYQSQFS